jgi:peroxiredoxin
MKKISVPAILLVLFFCIPGCSTNSNHKGDIGTEAEDFWLQSTTGRKIHLSDYRGKIVLLDFWATWCPPCRRGIPDLISLQEDFKNNLVVIGISTDRDTKGNVSEFMQQQGINYTVAYADEEISESYGGINAIPTSFVIDKNGTIVDKHIGLVEKSVFSEKISELLK